MGRTGSLALLLFAAGAMAQQPTEKSATIPTEAHAILKMSCVKCHGPTKQKGGLRFDSRAGATSKGDSGEVAIIPGKSTASEMIRRLTTNESALRMPPGDKPLSATQVEVLRRWIDAGAVWSNSASAPVETRRGEMTVTEEDRQHWAFRPLTLPPPPSTPAGNPIDRFILASLAVKGLAHAPPATREQLIRRVTFRMIGLPPTPEEVQAFVTAVDLDRAYEALVDRLLASPQYGERWGRHWLDVARYADSDGYESDADRPNAYHYRDFVVRAFQEDLPFDEFVRRQLAGDEYWPDNPQALAATGFLAAGPSAELPDRLLEEERIRQRYIELDDMVTTTGTALLGLTLGCARCHDHKFDPLPTRDYYRLMAALQSGDRAEIPLGTRSEVQANRTARSQWQSQWNAVEKRLKEWLEPAKKPHEARLRREKIDRLPITRAEKTTLHEKPDSPEGKALARKHQKALTVSDSELRSAMDASTRQRWDQLLKERDSVRQREPQALPVALGYRDSGAKPAPTWLLARGDHHDHSTPVELGFISVLTHDKSPEEYWKEARAHAQRSDTTQQRRALADWMTDTKNGAGALLARVIVNRVWQHHFGEGLVRTPNDFGLRGDRPTHPALLEWLAADLVAHGWKLKRLHRAILLSATYRQGNTSDGKTLKGDPDNRLLGRMRPLRLEAEALRDTMLAVSGTINPEMYGPGFKPAIMPEAMVARNLKTAYPTDVPDSPAVRRRSVYLFHKRVVPYPLFQAFDVPDAQQCTGRRNVTTVAPQALAVLNDPFVRNCARDFAERLRKDAGDDPAKQIDRAYRLAFGRSPVDAQRNAGIEFLARQQKARSARDPKLGTAAIQQLALTDYCQALFGLNEFIYVD